MRIENKLRNEHERAVIIHLGDHDPSGKDMTRDIDERIKMFLERDGFSDNFEIQRVALEMGQIKKYNPPPHPAKLTDSRCGGYISKYGYSSWELDALEPSVLDNIVQSAILENLNLCLYNERAKEEAETKKRLIDYAENFQ